VKLKLQLIVYAAMLLAMSGLFLKTAQVNVFPVAHAAISDYADVFKNGLVPCGHKDDPAGKRPDDTCTIEDIFKAVARVTNFLIGFAGIFVIYKLVGAGFNLVTANGNQQAIEAAKGNMANAFWGLLLVLIAYILVNLVLYTILQLKGPQDIITNPTNFIQSK